MYKILLVEDDASIVRNLTEYLKNEGFSADSADGAAVAEAKLRSEKWDLLLVDVSLSDGNGYIVCEAAKQLKLPVIFLTASDDERSVVKGLDMGADDYISKPFRPRELISRIRSVMRRYSGTPSVVTLNDLTVDTEKGVASKGGETIPLSALEYRILIMFINNRGRLLTREKLLEEIWDIAGDFVNDNTLTVYIKRLREKIEDNPQEPTLIKTVRGIGYRLD